MVNSKFSREEATDQHGHTCHLWHGGPLDNFPLGICKLRATLGHGHYVVLNHVENRDELINSGLMHKNVAEQAHATGEDVPWLLDAIMMTSQVSGEQHWARLQQMVEKHAQRGLDHTATWWVCKETHGRSKHKFVGRSVPEIKAHVMSKPAGHSLLVQKYVPNALVLGGSHATVHAACLVGTDGSVYLYDTLYCCAREAIGPQSEGGRFRAAVQRLGLVKSQRDLGSGSFQLEAGSELAIEDVAKMTGGRVTAQGLQSEVSGICRSVFDAVADKLMASKIEYMFELFEASFMVTAEGRLKLLSFTSGTDGALISGAHSPFRDLVHARLVEEMLQICLDTIYPYEGDEARVQTRGGPAGAKGFRRNAARGGTSSAGGSAHGAPPPGSVDYARELRKYVSRVGGRPVDESEYVVHVDAGEADEFIPLYRPGRKMQHFRHVGITVGEARKKPSFPARRAGGDGAGAGEGPRPRWFLMASETAALVAEALERRGTWRSFSAENRFILGHQGKTLLISGTRVSNQEVVSRARVGLWWSTVPELGMDWSDLRADEGLEVVVAGVPGSSCLWRKDLLAKTVAAHAQLTKQELPGWFPETYVVHPSSPAGGDPAWARLQARMAAGGGKERWLVKPRDGRGAAGFSLATTADAVAERLAGSSDPMVVQKYVDNPMLLHGGVSDARAFVLVDPTGTVYVHKTMLFRRSNVPFNRGDSDALNLPTMVVGGAEEFTVMLPQEFQLSVEMSHGRTTDLAHLTASILTQVQDAVRWVMAAAAPRLYGPNNDPWAHGRGVRAFELLSFDFAITARKQLLLLEVNGSPALAPSRDPSQAAAEVLFFARLVEEVLQLCVDPHVPPSKPQAVGPVGLLDSSVSLGPGHPLRDFTAVARVIRSEFLKKKEGPEGAEPPGRGTRKRESSRLGLGNASERRRSSGAFGGTGRELAGTGRAPELASPRRARQASQGSQGGGASPGRGPRRSHLMDAPRTRQSSLADAGHPPGPAAAVSRRMPSVVPEAPSGAASAASESPSPGAPGPGRDRGGGPAAPEPGLAAHGRSTSGQRGTLVPRSRAAPVAVRDLSKRDLLGGQASAREMAGAPAAPGGGAGRAGLHRMSTGSAAARGMAPEPGAAGRGAAPGARGGESPSGRRSLDGAGGAGEARAGEARAAQQAMLPSVGARGPGLRRNDNSQRVLALGAGPQGSSSRMLMHTLRKAAHPAGGAPPGAPSDARGSFRDAAPGGGAPAGAPGPPGEPDEEGAVKLPVLSRASSRRSDASVANAADIYLRAPSYQKRIDELSGPRRPSTLLTNAHRGFFSPDRRVTSVKSAATVVRAVNAFKTVANARRAPDSMADAMGLGEDFTGAQDELHCGSPPA